MENITIHAVFNKAEKSAEFVITSQDANTLEELLGDKASQFTWLRPFKDKKGSYPSKCMLDGLTWDDLQALKQFSKATGSRSEHSIRIWTGKSHLDIAWSADYSYEDCSYWVHVTGPLHWKSIDTLEEVLDRYIYARGLFGPSRGASDSHLLTYVNAYRDIPSIFEVETSLWDRFRQFDVFSDFNGSGIFTTNHVTANSWLIQIDVMSNGTLRLTAHKLGTPWEQTELLAEIPYGIGWQEYLNMEFLRAVNEYSSM